MLTQNPTLEFFGDRKRAAVQKVSRWSLAWAAGSWLLPTRAAQRSVVTEQQNLLWSEKMLSERYFAHGPFLPDPPGRGAASPERRHDSASENGACRLFPNVFPAE